VSAAAIFTTMSTGAELTQQQRRAAIRTALALGALALAFFIASFLALAR
jgi:hypothetical protein